jgi:hypothetical protein
MEFEGFLVSRSCVGGVFVRLCIQRIFVLPRGFKLFNYFRDEEGENKKRKGGENLPGKESFPLTA